VPPSEKLYYHEDLAEAGIKLTRKRLFELRRLGQFPEPLVIGGRRVAWKQSDLDKYLASRPRADVHSAVRADSGGAKKGKQR
jgi:predicted DNA-binding transcriptional regulator AlpA